MRMRKEAEVVVVVVERERSVSATLAVCDGCWRSGGAMEEGGRLHLPDRSPQGVDVLLLPVLHGVGIPAGALIPYVAGHRERDHLVGHTKRQEK